MSTGIRVRTHVACAVALGMVAGAWSQEREVRRMHQQPALEYSIGSGDSSVTVPFTIVNRHVVIPVSVNGSEPFHVILDTGMPANGLALYRTARVEALELEILPMRARVGGAGGDGTGMEAELAAGATYNVGDIELRGGHTILIPPVDHFAADHDGVIGLALFANFAVSLDYDAGTVTFTEPDAYQVPEGATELPITMRNRLPYTDAVVTAMDGTRIPVHMVVDLGAGHPVSLSVDTHEDLEVPRGALETVIGKGLGGPVRGQVGRIRSLELAGQKLRNVIATFPVQEHQNPRGLDQRNGNLGNGILERFHVTFDYHRKRMVLQPNDRFGDPFEWDMSGIRLRRDRAEPFGIEALLPDSPAARAGLQPGDILTHVDGRTVTDLGFRQVRDLLQRDGAEVALAVRRGGKNLEFQVKLRRLV